MRKNIREQLETETAKKLADYLASLTEKDIIDCYFLDNDTFTIRFSLYGNESVVNNIIEIIHDNDLVDFFAEYGLMRAHFIIFLIMSMTHMFLHEQMWLCKVKMAILMKISALGNSILMNFQEML